MLGNWHVRFGGGPLEKYEPPLGKRGHRRRPVINRFIEDKMERASNAKEVVEFKVNGHSLDIRYIVEDPATGQETLIKEHLTTGDPADLERIHQRLTEMYLDPAR